MRQNKTDTQQSLLLATSALSFCGDCYVKLDFKKPYHIVSHKFQIYTTIYKGLLNITDVRH